MYKNKWFGMVSQNLVERNHTCTVQILEKKWLNKPSYKAFGEYVLCLKTTFRFYYSGSYKVGLKEELKYAA